MFENLGFAIIWHGHVMGDTTSQNVLISGQHVDEHGNREFRVEKLKNFEPSLT